MRSLWSHAMADRVEVKQGHEVLATFRVAEGIPGFVMTGFDEGSAAFRHALVRADRWQADYEAGGARRERALREAGQWER